MIAGIFGTGILTILKCDNMKKTNFKDKATNVCGLIVFIAGTILALPTAGVTLPAVIVTASTVSLTVAGSIVAYLTGKTGDGKPKE